MTIHITDLSFMAFIGILEHERHNKQRVIVDLEIKYDFNGNNFLDYALIAQSIESHIRSSRYGLLEDALSGLSRHLIEEYPEITKLWLKITKPEIMDNCVVSLSDSWDFSKG